MITRRDFLGLAAAALSGLAVSPAAGLARGGRRPEHPDPRPGIDARDITPGDQLPADVVEVFDRAREIPQVLDGIACQCGCDALADMRSLLSCFEGHGMARHCLDCQGQADLAHRMTRTGRSLDEVRAAVEEQFG